MIRRHLMPLRVALMLGDGVAAASVFLLISFIRFGDGAWMTFWSRTGIDIRVAAMLFGGVFDDREAQTDAVRFAADERFEERRRQFLGRTGAGVADAPFQVIGVASLLNRDAAARTGGLQRIDREIRNDVSQLSRIRDDRAVLCRRRP